MAVSPVKTKLSARWLPLAALGVAMAATYGLGLQHYFSLQSIVENQTALDGFVSRHLLTALVIYFAAYVFVTSLSLPGAAALSIAGGFVFGWLLSGSVTIIAATLGAICVFKIVQTSVGTTFVERAGALVQRISRGFEKDAFTYMLFLRLVPAFPFFAVNVAAGLTGIKLRTFALGTLIGIIPGSYAFAWLGRGLGSVIDAARTAHSACLAQHDAASCPFAISLTSLVTPQLLWAFALLGFISLIPIALKKWNAVHEV